MSVGQQSIEFLSRLRRRLGFRGDVRVEVSDLVSPTVLTEDVTGLPWRLDGRRWFALANRAGVAGQRIEMIPSRDVSTLATLDSVELVNLTAAAVTVIGSVYGSCLLNVATEGAYALERATDGFTVAGSTNVPISIDVRQDAQVLTTKIIGNWAVPALSSRTVPLDLPLSSNLVGTEADFGCTPIVFSSSAGEGLRIGFSGRLWVKP